MSYDGNRPGIFSELVNRAGSMKDTFNTYNPQGVQFGLSYEEFLISIGYGFTAQATFTVAKTTSKYLVAHTLEDIIIINNRNIDIKSDGAIDAELRVFENATITDNGTLMPIFNLDLNNATTTDFTMYKESTADVSGADELPFSKPIVSDKNFLGGSTVQTNYFMKANTFYVMEVKNLSLSNDITVLLSWRFGKKFIIS